MLQFEYDGPNNGGVIDRDTEMAFIRENMPPATSYYHDDAGFTVVIWDTGVPAEQVIGFDIT